MSSSERIGYLRRARDLMDLRFAEPLDLGQMAAHAGFSKFHFARAFKERGRRSYPEPDGPEHRYPQRICRRGTGAQ